MADTDAAPLPDPFDLANLRLPQSFAEGNAVKKLLRTVPVRKPNPQDFVRVHSSPAYRGDFPIIELKDEREDYLVAGPLVAELVGEFKAKTLFTAVNRQGVVFLWPVPLPPAVGRQNEWHRSAREAAELSMEAWTRTKANIPLGAYEMWKAESVMHDPVWPDASFQELIRIAFRERLISSADHPVIRRLRGLA